LGKLDGFTLNDRFENWRKTLMNGGEQQGQKNKREVDLSAPIDVEAPSALCVELTSSSGALIAAIIMVLKEDDGSKAEPTLALAMIMFFSSVRSLNGYINPNFSP
jgi:hypothetical protein